MDKFCFPVSKQDRGAIRDIGGLIMGNLFMETSFEVVWWYCKMEDL